MPGSMTEHYIYGELKKGNDETKTQLQLLLAEQQRTNQLLIWIGQLLQQNDACQQEVK